MSATKRRLIIWHDPDGFRTVAALGFSPEQDREDLDRVQAWASSRDRLLVVDADVEVEIHP